MQVIVQSLQLSNKILNPKLDKVGSMPGWQDHDDIELLKKAQGGEAGAFGELYERHARAIFRFFSSHVGDSLDAEDLTEEVFLKVWRSMASYRDRGVPFLAFLFKIARNTLIDYYRRSGKKEQPVSVEETVIRDDTSDPGEQAMSNLEHVEIRQVLDQLRDDYRTVLVLRFLSDLSPEETAHTMGRSAGAIRVLQHRALAAARELLDGR
jgi:RNA polymerase sigma-70 factor, ECF subfamily